MKAQGIVVNLAIVLLLCFSMAEPASGQAQKDYFVVDFAASFNQATVTKARMGFFGFDIFAGRMLSGSLCVGIYTGYDIVSFRKVENYTERLGVIPMLAKVKYYFTLSPMLQINAFAACGAYRTVPHLSSEPVGTVWYAQTQPGFSAGFGVDYWFLLTQGFGFAFEYHFFNTDSDETFSYFSARVSYSMIRF